jgi:hypothetical protein
MEAIFDGNVDTCTSDDCESQQNKPLTIPEYLFSEVEQFVIKELTMAIQIPTDGPDDSQNTHKKQQRKPEKHLPDQYLHADGDASDRQKQHRNKQVHYLRHKVRIRHPPNAAAFRVQQQAQDTMDAQLHHNAHLQHKGKP